LLARDLPGLTGKRSDILEGDGALDFLAGKDSLVVPADKDADVGRVVGRSHWSGRKPSARDEGESTTARW
jgi:hypothetical protein